MHGTAMKIGGAFFRHYLSGSAGARVLDVGGLDVNGTLRSAAPDHWEYVSVDMVAGPGVDVVLDDPYAFPFAEGAFDAVVSTSCFEHDLFFWITFNEMCRVCRSGGYVYLNVPSSGAYHRYPDDCWRFYPDAGLALERWASRSGHRVVLCESFIALDYEDVWNDFVGIFRKQAGPDPAVEPIHRQIACENVRVDLSGELLHPNTEVQHLRELRMLRRRLGYDECRSALGSVPPAGGPAQES